MGGGDETAPGDTLPSVCDGKGCCGALGRVWGRGEVPTSVPGPGVPLCLPHPHLARLIPGHRVSAACP